MFTIYLCLEFRSIVYTYVHVYAYVVPTASYDSYVLYRLLCICLSSHV